MIDTIRLVDGGVSISLSKEGPHTNSIVFHVPNAGYVIHKFTAEVSKFRGLCSERILQRFTSLETSATLPGECGRKMAPPVLFMPMSFSMSKYWVIIIISITSRLLISAYQTMHRQSEMILFLRLQIERVRTMMACGYNVL